MPTFTAVVLGQLLESRLSESVDRTAHNPMSPQNSIPPIPKPAIIPKMDRRNSRSDAERKVQPPRMTPALYATPEATPVPDSPSSYSASPYVINHKRRGPRLVKSYSEGGVSSSIIADEEKAGQNQKDEGNSLFSSADDIVARDSVSKLLENKNVNEVNDSEVGGSQRRTGNIAWEVGCSNLNDSVGEGDRSHEPDPSISENFGDGDDFYDPQDSWSQASYADEDNSISASYRSSNQVAPVSDFFDAWEELSSDGGLPVSSVRLEEELRGIRLSILVEMEKRKQAEEALGNMQSQWERIKQELALVGITLPAYDNLAGNQLSSDALENLHEQVCISRYVADAVGRGTAKAEVETVMEAQIEAKNFEIARLMDRLNYYEAVNHEMSQRNQEAIERARRLRQRRKRKQKWVWGSVAAVLSLGSAALLWSFYPAGKGLSTTSHSDIEHSIEAGVMKLEQ